MKRGKEPIGMQQSRSRWTKDGGRGTAWAMMVLRVVVGAVFVAHGAQKLFVFGHAGVAGAFTHMGIPLPGLTSAIVAPVEFLGGLALVLGLFSRIAAALLAVDMLGAIVLVHARHGFFLPTGAEFALTLLGANVAQLLGGPGALALGELIGRRRRAATGDGARATVAGPGGAGTGRRMRAV